MNGLRRTLVVLSLVCVAGCGARPRALPVPTAKPEEVGLSSAQLKKIEEATAKNIDEGIIPGAVMLVARRGKVAWVSVQGKREPGSADPMKLDSIFRIYSMTKPMVTTALMQMVEEGRLQVSDPVSKFLPAIGSMKVGTEVDRPRRQADAAALRSDAADDGAGPDAPHLGPGLRHARHQPRLPGLHGGQDRRPRRRPTRSSSRASPRCRCTSIPATAGNTASPSTCRAACSRCWPASRCARCWASASSSRSA